MMKSTIIGIHFRVLSDGLLPKGFVFEVFWENTLSEIQMFEWPCCRYICLYDLKLIGNENPRYLISEILILFMKYMNNEFD